MAARSKPTLSKTHQECRRPSSLDVLLKIGGLAAALTQAITPSSRVQLLPLHYVNMARACKAAMNVKAQAANAATLYVYNERRAVGERRHDDDLYVAIDHIKPLHE